MSIVKETNFVPILSQPQINNFAQVVSNKNKSLTLAFCLEGPDANHFGKDLEFQIHDWEANNAQTLHHLLLDLVQYCRLKKLDLKFALCLITEEQLILSTLHGKVLLKRNQISREILGSQQEINMIVGKIKPDDQLVLLTNHSQDYAAEILELMKIGFNQKKIISELTVKVSRQTNLSSIAFLTCQEKSKLDLKKQLKTQSISAKEKLIKIIKNIPQKIKIIAKKIQNLFKKIKKLDQKQRKKCLFILLSSICLLLALFIFASYRKEQLAKSLAATQVELQNLSQNLDKAQERLNSEPLAVRQETELLIENLKKLASSKKDRGSKNLLTAEIARYENLAQLIDSENNLDRLNVYSDWHQAYPNFIGQKIALAQGSELYVLNSEKNELLRIDQNKNIEQKTVDKINDFAPVKETEAPALYLLGAGIQRIQWSDAAQTQLKEEGESDRGAEFFNSYGPYLYLLNREKRNVYRYYDREDAFSEPIGWLVEKQGINFQLISDMLVDGDLYLAFENGQLLKFSRGHSEDFAVTGLSEPFAHPLIIASQEEAQKIAVLEKKNKRLVLLTKDGQVISEIKSNELAGVADIEISADGNVVYALSGSVIYEIAL